MAIFGISQHISQLTARLVILTCHQHVFIFFCLYQFNSKILSCTGSEGELKREVNLDVKGE
jgi:hypothetical protein